MLSGKTKLKIKNAVKQTSWGKRLRYIYQRRGLFSRVDAEATVKKYLGDNISRELLDEIVDDMLVEAREHDFAFYEYMMYHFYDMPMKERREYVSALERITFCERMNNDKNVIIFDDKGATYKKYKSYYKRDLIEIPGDGFECFLQFVAKHPRFIVKPFDGACGYGVKIIDGTTRTPTVLYQ